MGGRSPSKNPHINTTTESRKESEELTHRVRQKHHSFLVYGCLLGNVYLPQADGRDFLALHRVISIQKFSDGVRVSCQRLACDAGTTAASLPVSALMPSTPQLHAQLTELVVLNL